MDHDMTTFAQPEPIFNIVPKPAAAAWVAPVRLDTSSMPLLDTSTLPNNIFWDVLGTALTLRRDYGSATESAFVAWLARKLPVTLIDAAGNLHVDTRTDPTHRSMFTAHTDTVHNNGGVNKVHVDGKFWRASSGAALGADDGAGCAILSYMIECGVPGYFVFFRGEERGGVGSSWLAQNMPELFNDIDRAVAFDRAGYYDVITHQRGGRCCSDEFAQALSDALSTADIWMMPCDSGVYTDTAEFVRLIPECTNVSVGYKNQHGDREEQDVEFLWDLAKGAVGVGWDALPTRRNPKARDMTNHDAWAYRSIGANDARDAYADWDDVAAPAEDSPEALALQAIDAFRDRTDRLWLIDLVADAVHPDDPGLALRHMKTQFIEESDLDVVEEMLMDGWSADQALATLYDVCAEV